MAKNTSRLQRVSQRAKQKVLQLLNQVFRRSTIANLMMFSFILLTAVGAGMIYFPAGFITAGVACGIFGFLLGSE